jgi:hypothetical protein
VRVVKKSPPGGIPLRAARPAVTSPWVVVLVTVLRRRATVVLCHHTSSASLPDHESGTDQWNAFVHADLCAAINEYVTRCRYLLFCNSVSRAAWVEAGV